MFNELMTQDTSPVSHVTEASDSATRIASIASTLCPFVQEIKIHVSVNSGPDIGR
jgi:hypothetical protein